MAQKAASSSLVSGFLCQFPHRMDIRCFLTVFSGQEEEPSQPVCGEEIGAESGVKLACKPILVPISPSDGHPVEKILVINQGLSHILR